MEEEGLLVPRSRNPSIKNVWRVSDGHDLLAKVPARRVKVAIDDAEWETLLWARRRTGISLARLMEAVEAGELVVGALDGAEGFHGIVVRLDQLGTLVGPQERPDLTEGVRLQSAAALGRSIGCATMALFWL